MFCATPPSVPTVIVAVTTSPIFIATFGIETADIVGVFASIVFTTFNIPAPVAFEVTDDKTGLFASIASAFCDIAVVNAVEALPAGSVATTEIAMFDPAATSVPPLVTVNVAVYEVADT